MPLFALPYVNEQTDLSFPHTTCLHLTWTPKQAPKRSNFRRSVIISSWFPYAWESNGVSVICFLSEEKKEEQIVLSASIIFSCTPPTKAMHAYIHAYYAYHIQYGIYRTTTFAGEVEAGSFVRSIVPRWKYHIRKMRPIVNRGVCYIHSMPYTRL